MRDQQNQGNGLRCLVFNFVIDSKIYSDFSSLTVDIMFFHLHIASNHYGLPTTKSIDLANLMLHNTSKYKQLIHSEVLSDIYQNSIVRVLTTHGIIKDQDEATSILQEIQDCVQTQLQSNCGKSSSADTAAPVNHKTV